MQNQRLVPFEPWRRASEKERERERAEKRESERETETKREQTVLSVVHAWMQVASQAKPDAKSEPGIRKHCKLEPQDESTKRNSEHQSATARRHNHNPN